jgi:protein-S-isoprenylcysteine O-methyltransferase Ste14
MALQGKGTPLPAETARELVVAGPYRIVRNPMAVCGALQTIGVGLILGSWTVIAIAVAGAVLWNVVIRPGEEADLAARFGPAYDRYRTQVRCWIPTPARVRRS